MARSDEETGQVKVTVQPKVMPDDAEEFKRGLQLPQLDNPHITVEVTLSADSPSIRSHVAWHHSQRVGHDLADAPRAHPRDQLFP
ncbi:hypothetical protein GCM10018952_17750 [Streptosporangium vulgare]